MNIQTFSISYNFGLIVSFFTALLTCYYFYLNDMNILKAVFSIFREHEITKKYHKDLSLFWKLLYSYIAILVISIVIFISAVSRNFALLFLFTVVLFAIIVYSIYLLYMIYAKVFEYNKLKRYYAWFFIIPYISFIGWGLLILTIKNKKKSNSSSKKAK